MLTKYCDAMDTLPCFWTVHRQKGHRQKGFQTKGPKNTDKRATDKKAKKNRQKGQKPKLYFNCFSNEKIVFSM